MLLEFGWARGLSRIRIMRSSLSWCLRMQSDVCVCTSINVSRLFLNIDVEEIHKFRNLVWGDSSFKNTLSLNLEAVKEEVSTEEALEMKVIDDIVTNEVYADLDCIRLYKQCIILGLG
ncbi:uncharacterized protein LOC130994690 isoform X3 [Salvia miltiorrhiza]|uniref:uncharacterized protein LOC130994690 isoform X3 n=1 Tax=Salvia miltiorrhiza TaxID=226208 RepID=UPI0025AB754F|nr:uncharacterized protein LOC130994690 isoform X3 [Salvia miltiorrhiza]